MKIIFAQGNPGAQYSHSRHNVGFMMIDQIATEHGLTFIKKPKFYADIAEYTFAGEKILLVKPNTFYNETGQSARALVDFYKVVPSTDVLAVHDDLALPFGTIRVRSKGSDGGNNGIKSLNAHLGTDYTRLRIGIYNELRDRVNDADFVLSNFTKNEADLLNDTIGQKVRESIELFCAGNLDAVSHKLD